MLHKLNALQVKNAKPGQRYRRGDALEKRRALIQAWADYLEGE